MALRDRLDEFPVSGILLKGVLSGGAYATAGYAASGSVPVTAALSFGVAFAVVSVVFDRLRG